MNICTLVLPVRDGNLYLALKKLKVGAGLYNGWGGKMEPEDQGDPDRTAVREFRQETRLAKARIEDLSKVAIIDFFMAGAHIFECHMYFLFDWEGEMRETSEMGKSEAFPIDNPPLEHMMEADRLWLPVLLQGQKIRGKCYYTAGNRTVEKFEYKAL